MFNRKDFILHKKGILSEEDCKRIIYYFETHQTEQKPGTVAGNSFETPDRKKDTEIHMNFNDKTSVSLWILDCLNRCVGDYLQQYPFINTLYYWNVDQAFNLQRYKPNEGYFSLHCEHDGPPEEINKRLLAWMIYLNDVKDGGHTEFPHQKRKFQPRKGDVLIWPAYFTHPHRGIVSKTETKYIATGWYCYDDL